MSFATFDVEAQRTTSKHNDESELDKLITSTSTQLQLFGQLVSQFDHQRKQIGTRRDTLELRNSIDEMSGKTNQVERAIQTLIQQLALQVNSGKGQNVNERHMVIKERLVSEFNQVHKQFQRLLQQYKDKKRAYPLKSVIPDENTPLIDHLTEGVQEQQLIQEESINETDLQYHVQLTEERNREIERVSQGIQDVNTIFKDLNLLVTQQGEQIDTIEDNILQHGANAQQADRELVKAHETQKRKGKWSCIVLVALSVFMLVVVLAVIS